jgi:NTP pyrophosphatase (non-canonical NTP hydrolase)
MITHPELVSRLCKPGEDILDTLTPKKCHLWHMMTGLVGEVIELKEAWLKQDVPNIIEELGDIRFYIQGFIQTFDVVDSIKYYNEPLAKEPIDTIFLLDDFVVTEANTTKLSTRYPELCFTDKHAALRLDKSSEE